MSIQGPDGAPTAGHVPDGPGDPRLRLEAVRPTDAPTRRRVFAALLRALIARTEARGEPR